MLRVMLVDDEIIERESIAALVDWCKNGYEFAGAAKNGVEAYEMIRQQHPAIVITDIKMPVVSGIDLIEKVQKIAPDIVFIVLSGYGDYEYTSKAMLFGVRHYLLKPVDETRILQALGDARREIEAHAHETQRIQSLEGKLGRVLPHVKEQFLRGCAQTKIYSPQDCSYFQSMFGIVGESFRLVNLYFPLPCSFLDQYALLNIAEETIGWDQVVLSTTIESHVVLLIRPLALTDIEERAVRCMKLYRQYFDHEFCASASRKGRFGEIHELYEETLGLLQGRFGCPNEKLLTEASLRAIGSDIRAQFLRQIGQIADMVQNGAVEDLGYSLEIFHKRLDRDELDAAARRTCIQELYRAIARLADTETCREYPEAELSALGLDEAAKRVAAFCRTVAARKYQMAGSGGNPLIRSIRKSIYENITDPELSLSWISKNVLYMNEEYLGRVFLKETGEKFSAFVLRTRIEMAKKLMESTNDLKIYEISQMTGFPEDAQYFSRIFKSITQYTPSQYRQKFGKSLP